VAEFRSLYVVFSCDGHAYGAAARDLGNKWASVPGEKPAHRRQGFYEDGGTFLASKVLCREHKGTDFGVHER
jgi:hypothetical protein